MLPEALTPQNFQAALHCQNPQVESSKCLWQDAVTGLRAVREYGWNATCVCQPLAYPCDKYLRGTSCSGTGVQQGRRTHGPCPYIVSLLTEEADNKLTSKTTTDCGVRSTDNTMLWLETTGGCVWRVRSRKGKPLGKRPFNQDPGEKEEPGMFLAWEKHSSHRGQWGQRFGAGESMVCFSSRKEEVGGRKFGIHEGDEDRRSRS